MHQYVMYNIETGRYSIYNAKTDQASTLPYSAAANLVHVFSMRMVQCPNRQAVLDKRQELHQATKVAW